MSKDRVERVREMMMAGLQRKITLEELAAGVGLSPYYFLRMFKAATGMTPHAYLTRLRLERSKRLLLQGNSLCDVALAVGFYDQSHFSRCFKEAYALTPGDYVVGR